MGWIKKTLIFILGLIAILAISFFVFKYYRASKAADIKIPENSFSVIQLDVDDLIVEMFQNSISNYSDYYGAKRDTISKEKKSDLWNIGVHIPAKLYMFSLSDTSYQYFGILEVSNSNKIKSFLQNQLRINPDSIVQNLEKGQEYYSSKELKVLLNAEKLVFSIGGKEDLESLKSLIQADQSKWVLANNFGAELKEVQGADLSYVDRNKNWASVDFKDGKFDLKGYIKSSLFGFPAKPVQVSKSDDYVLHLSLNSDLSLILKEKEAALEKFKLPIDSLHKYIGNYAAVELLDKEVMESDTIITYDYDDNFEMIEKKEVNQVEVPALAFQVKASPHLLGYLPEKMFYKFSKNYSDGFIHLSTIPTPSASLASLKPSENVFEMYYQKKANADKYLSWLPNYDKIQAGTLFGQAEDANIMRLNGEFKLENSRLNAFYQIFVAM